MSAVASSSKQPSESSVFPAVDSFVQRLANDSIRSKKIDNLSSSDEMISILGEEFNNVAVAKSTAPDSVFSNHVGVGGRAAYRICNSRIFFARTHRYKGPLLHARNQI